MRYHTFCHVTLYILVHVPYYLNLSLRLGVSVRKGVWM